MDQMTFSIGEAAKRSDLSVKAIRYYEEIGLIPKPDRTNGGAHTGGHRVYTEADVGRLRFIQHARMFGLALSDVRALVAVADGKGCPSSQPEYRAILQRHLRAIDERINHLLGLRTAIGGLMSPARRSRGEKCSWETCGCMQKVENAGRRLDAPAERFPQTPQHG
ncbi:MAG: MerR family transcriptional regulator [Betaproteobacteria bacterium]